MKRKKLLDLLEQYSPVNEEIRYKADILAFVHKYEECFERSLEIGHITSSAWLLNKEGSKVLLTHHAKLNRWLQLGGHCDGDPDVLRSALREAREESGIEAIEPVQTNIFDIDIHPIPETAKEKAHFHYDVRFLLRVTSDEKFTVSKESKQLRWVGKDPSEWPTDEFSMLRLFRKWKELRSCVS